MAIRVRRIRPTDWQLLRELRLAALVDAPRAFGQSHEEAAAQPPAEWAANARSASSGHRRVWFVAEDEAGRAVGLVHGRRRPPDDCLLFSMWVAPEARRDGAGSALVDAVGEWGAEWGASRVVLWVIRGNDGAREFYERIGFKAIDHGPDAESGAAHGAVPMARPIERAG